MRLKASLVLNNLASDRDPLTQQLVVESGILGKVVVPVFMAEQTPLNLKTELLCVFANLLQGCASLAPLTFLAGECQLVDVVATALVLAVQ